MTTTDLHTTATAPAIIAPSTRRAPWDVMGAGLEADYGTVSEALAASGLDFQVDMRPVFAHDTDADDVQVGNLLDDGGHRAVVRPMPDGTRRVVGVTGNRFTPIPNADAFAVADVLTAEWGARITTAADYRTGAASLLVVTLPEPVVVTGKNGTDETAMHLLMKNAHDGSSALTFALTGLRLACTNALQAAIANAPRAWKVSHTPNHGAQVNLAHQAILHAVAYQDAFQAQAQAMMDQEMVDAEFTKMLASLWPVTPAQMETRAGQNRLRVREDLEAIYHTSSTLDAARGTLWGGYNAITEWADWGRNVRGGDVYRAEGSLEGATVRFKERVWGTFSAAV